MSGSIQQFIPGNMNRQKGHQRLRARNVAGATPTFPRRATGVGPIHVGPVSPTGVGLQPDFGAAINYPNQNPAGVDRGISPARQQYSRDGQPASTLFMQFLFYQLVSDDKLVSVQQQTILSRSQLALGRGMLPVRHVLCCDRRPMLTLCRLLLSCSHWGWIESVAGATPNYFGQSASGVRSQIVAGATPIFSR